MPRLNLPPEIEALWLEGCRDLFESATGDGKATGLFKAIRFCGNQGLPLPEWAVQAFFDATNAWFGLSAGSLDAAFGTAPVTEKRLARMRRRRLLRLQVANEVSRIKGQRLELNATGKWEPVGGPVDWDRLAADMNSSKTVLQDLYYGRNRSRAKPLSRTPKRKRGMKLRR